MAIVVVIFLRIPALVVSALIVGVLLVAGRHSSNRLLIRIGRLRVLCLRFERIIEIVRGWLACAGSAIGVPARTAADREKRLAPLRRSAAGALVRQ